MEVLRFRPSADFRAAIAMLASLGDWLRLAIPGGLCAKVPNVRTDEALPKAARAALTARAGTLKPGLEGRRAAGLAQRMPGWWQSESYLYPTIGVEAHSAIRDFVNWHGNSVTDTVIPVTVIPRNSTVIRRYGECNRNSP